VMYFDAPAGELDAPAASLGVVMGVTGLFTVLFWLFPAPLIAAAQAAVAALIG